MGKKSRPTPDGPNYAKKVGKALRQLGIPQPRSVSQWRTDCSVRVDVSEIDDFLDIHENHNSGLMAWCAESDDRVRVLWGGWYNQAIETECVWLVEHIAPYINNVENPVVVEIGAGLGFTAAVVSSVLNVPVVTVDPTIGAAASAANLAQMLSADVEPLEGLVSDAVPQLRSLSPSVVYAAGVLRYVQGHEHNPHGMFSDRKHMVKLAQNTLPTSELSALLDSVSGADVIGLEVTCTDWLGELEGAASRHGYHLDVFDPAMIAVSVLADTNSMVALRLSTTNPPMDASSLLLRLHPEASRPLAMGYSYEGVFAELGRTSTESLDMVKAVEFTFPEGIFRMEHATNGEVATLYESSTLGHRMLYVWAVNDPHGAEEMWTQRYNFFAEEVPRHEVPVPATKW